MSDEIGGAEGIEPAGEIVVELDDPGEPAEPDEADADPAARFRELVEERVRRLRYSHGLMRTIYTPDEQLLLAAVERQAALWVPTFTLVALVGSAVAVLVLATRVGRDPQQQGGTAFAVVLGAVVLLGSSFLALFRSEVHFARLRPRGRSVRADVADAYDAVRDAPRTFLTLGAGPLVLARVADLLPTADRLVDALVLYDASGGTLVRAHPAYDRIIRMRAEVEVLAGILADEPREPFIPMPRAEQVADFESLSDLAAFIGDESA